MKVQEAGDEGVWNSEQHSVWRSRRHSHFDDAIRSIGIQEPTQGVCRARKGMGTKSKD